MRFGAIALLTLTFLLCGPGFAAADAPADSAPAARLGFVAPTARRELTQPVLDRYAQDVRERVSGAVAVAIVPIPVDDGKSLANLATCRLLQLSGFFAPHRHWQVTDTSVVVDASFTISDCYGNLFFAGRSSRTEKRDQNAVPQAQVDAAQAAATADLMARFTRYKHVHQAAWDLMIGTGSVTGSPPSSPDAQS
jgi:hypothetical protein